MPQPANGAVWGQLVKCTEEVITDQVFVCVWLHHTIFVSAVPCAQPT